LNRKHNICSETASKRKGYKMAQAATLTQQQLQRVLDYLRTRRHYKRNRAIILLTHYAMLRVGEVAALRYCDVLETDGQIKAETTLSAAQTKGKRGRKIWFAEKVRAELAAYVAAHKPKQLTQPLFYTQRSDGFTANTLTHIVNGIYKGAGISGATSHSGRRTGLTNLAERGVGVRTLMALAGHSNMATTQRYIDLRPAVIKAAVELV
jgi:integrase/recombinase XerD